MFVKIVLVATILISCILINTIACDQKKGDGNNYLETAMQNAAEKK